jgi:hypothetical protein
MAALCQAASAHSLGELAAIAVRGGSLGSSPYVEFERGLRLIAGSPGSEGGAPEEIRQLLAEARTAHGLVVADSGVVGGSAASSVLAAATHVLLVMPATPIGVARGAQLLTSRIAPQQSATLVAVAPAAKSVRPRALRDLAEPFVERLVFVPHVAGLARGETAGTQLDLSLVAIASALRTP